jgi:hypothetical protein
MEKVAIKQTHSTEALFGPVTIIFLPLKLRSQYSSSIIDDNLDDRIMRRRFCVGTLLPGLSPWI